MNAPTLDVQVEPVESDKVVYLPLAAMSSGDATGVKIVLRLQLRNDETAQVKVSGIRFSFPASSQSAIDMQGVNADGSLDIAPDDEATWCSGIVELSGVEINNAVYLSGPPPSKIRVEVSCQGFSDPVTRTFDLAAHKSPVPEEAYRFPFAAGELRSGEYYLTDAVHSNGNAFGSQIFAHDIKVIGWDSSAGSWSRLLPGGDRMKNEDYRIWNKPIRAVADGVVESFHDGEDENTITEGADGGLQAPVPKANPVGGNNVIIRHGTELVKYSHMQKDTMVAEVKSVGAVVSEGQMLGRVGNTGNSTSPHTHMHCLRATDSALRPLPFRNAWVIDQTELSPPSSNGPWFRLRGHGIPKEAVHIWPASTSPGFPVPTVGISMAGDWASSFYIRKDLDSFRETAQDLFDNQGLRLIRLTTFLENGSRRWVGVSRTGDWANRWWISQDLASFKVKAQSLFDNDGLRLIYVDTFLEGNTRKWIGIARGGDWANRFVIRDDRASFLAATQDLFDNHGMRLIYILTWREGNNRKWFGISRSGDWANRWWVSPDLADFKATAQRYFDEEGKRLIHVTSYLEGNQRRWVGISRAGDWANRWYLRSDLDSFRLEAQRLFDDKHLRLIHIDMLE